MNFTLRSLLLCAFCICTALARPQNNNNWFGQFPNFPSPPLQQQQQQLDLTSLFINTQNSAQPQQQSVPQQQPVPAEDALLRTTAATPTTASPQYLNCLRTCPSTMEYNPLCGSDGEDYQNNGRLQCAIFCGRSVTALRMGTCEPQ